MPPKKQKSLLQRQRISFLSPKIKTIHRSSSPPIRLLPNFRPAEKKTTCGDQSHRNQPYAHKGNKEACWAAHIATDLSSQHVVAGEHYEDAVHEHF